MADKPFRCRLITPEARVFDADASYVSVPLWDGKRGFMANASAFVGQLGSGELRVEFVDRYQLGVKLEEAGSKSWFVSGGFVQHVNNVLTILASEAREESEITEAEAKKELEEANAKSSSNTLEMDRISHQRRRASAKLAMIHARRA